MRTYRIVTGLSLLLLTVGCAEYVEGETKGSAGLDSSTSDGSTSGDASATSGDAGSGSGGETTGASTTTTSSTSSTSTSTTTTTTSTTEPTSGDPTTSTTGSDSDVTATTGDSDSTTDASCVDNSGCDAGLICVDAECVTPTSCRAILESDAAAADGPYTVDPDGDGGAEPVEVVCDMATGGWSCVYFNDFEANADGWSKTGTSTCDGTKILGGYDKLGKDNPVNRTFDLLGIAHVDLRLNFDLVAVDSWDDELFRVEIDGEPSWSKKCDFNNNGSCNQSSNLCGSGIFDDGFLAVEVIVAHDAVDAQIHFTADLDENRKNESFGLDDVRVCVM